LLFLHKKTDIFHCFMLLTESVKVPYLKHHFKSTINGSAIILLEPF